MTMVTVDSLRGLSANALDCLARRAASLAADLRQQQPSYELALLGGVCDASYSTVRHGLVPSYSGTAVIEMADGTKWLAVGHGPEGTASYVSKDGYIEFIPQSCSALQEYDIAVADREAPRAE